MEHREIDVSTSRLSKGKLDELVEMVSLNLRSDDEVDELIDIVERFRQVRGEAACPFTDRSVVWAS